MMKLCVGFLMAAALLLSGCGKEERREAVTFYTFLNQKTAEFAATNALEKDLFGSTTAWCESITSGGAGRGKQLSENADSASALSQSAAVLSTQLGQLRQSVYEQPLKQEYPQTVRGNLVKQLMDRQKMLQQFRTALESSAADFKGFSQSRSYTGDSYPAGIDKLTAILKGYKGAENVLGHAIDDLRTKYKIVDAESHGLT